MASTTNTNTHSPEEAGEELDELKNQGNDAFRKVCKFSRLYFFVWGLICYLHRRSIFLSEVLLLGWIGI